MSSNSDDAPKPKGQFSESEDSLTMSQASETTKIVRTQTGHQLVEEKKVGVLQYSNGPEQGKIISLLTGRPYVFGRNRDSDICLNEASVSRKHAQIIVGPTGQAVVRDLGSTNGTRVNNDKVNVEKIINDGDLIRCGDHLSVRYFFLPEGDALVQAEIYKKATRDPLTNALNRASFTEALERELAVQARHGDKLLTLIMFDVDFFKKINDSFGHPAGDEVLSDIGRRVYLLIRKEDYFARLGGEEFALLTRNENMEGVQTLAERLREAMEKTPSSFEGRSIQFTISVGYTVLKGKDVSSLETLIKIADEALYEAKRSGRNRSVFKELVVST